MTDPLLFPALSVPTTEFVVKHVFQTDVITSRQGREQRRALRGNPRRQLEYTSTLVKQRWLDYARLMTRAQSNRVYVANESRVAVLASDLTSNSFTLSVIPSWMVTDQLLIFFLHDVGFWFSKVASVVGTTVNLTTSTSTTFATGARVYQALLGHLDLQMQRIQVVDIMTGVKVQFSEDPGTAVADYDIAAATTWNGREVFLFTPNAFTEVQITESSDREDVDYGLGALSSFDPTGLPHRLWQATYGMRALNAETLRAMFCRMKGQQGEFYMPTFENDLPPRVLATAGTNALSVAGTDVANDFVGSTTFKQICVFLDSKPIPTCLFNTVTSIAISGGNSLLTLANNWSQSLPIGTKISWMPVWRFATDILQQSWTFNTDLDVYVSMQPSFKMLEDL